MTRSNFPIRIQFGFRGWAAIIAGMAILAALALMAVGLLVFLLPVLLIVPVFFWLMPKPRPNPISHAVNSGAPRQAKDAEIIEGSFTVVKEADENLSRLPNRDLS